MSTSASASATEKKGVYIIALEEDAGTLEGLEIQKKLEDEGIQCEPQYSADPFSRPVSDLDKQLEKYDKILLIIPKQGSPWIKYCQAVLADKKPTIPLIIHTEIQIEDLDPDVKRLMCLSVSDKNYFDKLVKWLKKEKQDRDYGLPIAPIAPGLCANFFYGFLNIVLPTFGERLTAWKEKHGNQVPVVQQIVILTPKSCECKPELKDYAKEYISDKGIVECARNQIYPERNYDQHIYEVTNPEDVSEKYLVVLVLCSTMQTLHEMSQDPSCHLTPQGMWKERKIFEDKLQDLLEKHDVCKGKATMIRFDDDTNLASDICKKCRDIMGQK